MHRMDSQERGRTSALRWQWEQHRVGEHKTHFSTFIVQSLFFTFSNLSVRGFDMPGTVSPAPPHLSAHLTQPQTGRRASITGSCLWVQLYVSGVVILPPLKPDTA